MKVKRIKRSFLILLTIVAVLLGFIFFLSKPQVGLNGEEKISVGYKSEYRDKGVYVKRFNRLIEDNKYKVIINSNLDTDVLGEYTIDYLVLYKGKKYNLKRIVRVIDDEKPIIESELKKIEKEYCTAIDKSKIEYRAIDNYDGDLTDKVEIIETENEVKLKVKDKSGNIGILDIPINSSNKPDKELVMNGYEKMYIPLNSEYVDAGAYVSDGCGGDVSEDIITRGSVDTSKIGDYTITYSTSSGLTKKRYVSVYNPIFNSDNISDNEKVIYLTFDDGPGVYTQSILDTLQKYNVKATFFVTNQFGDYIHLLKDEVNNGHSVGVHTYTHKWDVYTSIDSYLNDFNSMNSVIKDYTGKKSNIFRFPGGSSNTVSKNFASGVVSAIASKMVSDGYVYFDWNVDSDDASGADSDSVYYNVVNGIDHCTKCVVLMHDIKYSTANALDGILSTLTSRGYKFGILDENSPLIQHGINN